MATIDYKEKYEKAVQAAMLAKQDTESAVTIGILEEIFPELRESEDERIRKEIIKFIDGDYTQRWITDETKASWIAWLKRQGEQKPAFEMKTPEESLGVDSDTYNEIVDECIYGELKPTYTKEYNFHGIKFVPNFKKGDLIREKLSGRILTIKDFSYDTGLYTYDTGQFPITIQNQYELVEQKPAWSKEDEKIIRRIDSLLYSQCKIHGSEYEEIHNWLKSLRPQNTWKPSDEQMDALEDAIADAISSIQKNMLNSLYSDLKKL